MVDGVGGLAVKQIQTFELRIQWIPETGQLQLVGSQMDDVTRFGMLEMAKVAISKQQSQGSQSMIVPGRFAS